MMSRKLSWLVVLGTVLVSSLAMARPPHDGMPSLKALAERLQLTPDQTAAAKASREAQKEAKKAVRATIEGLHGELQVLWAAESPDRTKILAKMREIGALKEQMAVSHVDGRLAFLKLLTPLQRAEMRKIAAEPRHVRMGRHKRPPA